MLIDGLNGPKFSGSSIDKDTRISLDYGRGEVVAKTYNKAYHYGDDGWYIEFVRIDARTNEAILGSYGYWKQGSDGGRLVSVDTRGIHIVENGIVI
jgi:hypothetical protein